MPTKETYTNVRVCIYCKCMCITDSNILQLITTDTDVFLSAGRMEMVGDDALRTWKYELKTRNFTGTKSPCGHLANRTFTKFLRIMTYRPVKILPHPPIHIKRLIRQRQKLKKSQTTTLEPILNLNFTPSNETSYFSSYEFNLSSFSSLGI